MFVRIIFISVFLISIAYAQNPEREFSKRQSYNINGDFKLIGNTSIWKSDWDSYNPSDPTNRNNAYHMEHVDIDSDGTTFNSSSVTLDLGDSNYEIVWAGLYWQGHVYRYGDNDDMANNYNQAMNLADEVKLKVPGSTNYIDLTADQHDYDATSYNNKYLYSSFVDVTQYVTQHGATSEYTVANVAASEGQIAEWGGLGGWALLVVYKDPSQNLSLKNISIFDGFKPVSSGSTVQVDLDGFLTPKSGTINSKLGAFVVDGDKEGTSLTKDEEFRIQNKKNTGTWDEIYNSINPNDNVFNSSITELGSHFTNKNPNFEDNLGVDIDVFDVSSSMDFEQSSTSFQFYTDGDLYLVDLLVFSTELYTPRVCYDQTIKNQEVGIGDILEFEIEIRNEPIGSETIEDAEGVTVRTVFDDVLDYNATSYPYLEFDDNQTITYWVGTGASMNTGGTLVSGAAEQVDVNVTLSDISDLNISDINLSNEYYVTYQYENSGVIIPFVDYAIGPCTDINNSISIIQPPTGNFNVVHDGADMSNGDPLAADHPKNALYTQVAEQEFNVDIVSLAADNIELEKYSGAVSVELVDWTNATDCKDANASAFNFDANVSFFDESKPAANNPGLDRVNIDNIQESNVGKNIRFRMGITDYEKSWQNANQNIPEFNCDDSNIDGGNLHGVPNCLNAEKKINNIFGEDQAKQCLDQNGKPCKSNNHGVGDPPYDNSYGCAQCLLGLLGANPIKDYVCSRDNFAIRPSHFNISGLTNDSNPEFAGRSYKLADAAKQYHIRAEDINNMLINEYDGATFDFALDKNSTYAPYILNRDGDKENMFGEVKLQNNKFTSGETKISFTDVGVIENIIYDTYWTAVDQNKSGLYNDCIDNNTTTIHNASKKLGCFTGVKADQSHIRFIPTDFNITALQLDNHKGGAYTYLSNDSNLSRMSATLPYSIDALNANNVKTQNYGDRKNGLWEQNVTIDSNLTFNGLYPSMVDVNRSARFKPMNLVDVNFTNGTATAAATDDDVIEFNFERNASVPHEPFDINKSNNDFNLTINDTDGVEGNASQPTGGIAKFYYANLYAPDVQSDQAVVDANVYIEVFCDNGSYGTTCAGFNLAQQSVDRVNWWQFPQHQSGSGELVAAESSASSVDIENDGTLSLLNLDLNAQNSLNVEYTGGNNHYKTKITIAPDSWLSYHKYIPYNSDPADNDQNFFYIQWDLGAGDWAGVGNVKSTVDVNASDNAQQRIDW